MKHRLIAGTINHWPDDDEWCNWHLDISFRPLYAATLNANVMPDFIMDIAHMPDVPAAMFDEVRSHHVFEHLPSLRLEIALEEVFRVLKPGGVFDVEVPDLDKICRAYLAGDLDFKGLHQWLYGEELAAHEVTDSHFSGFTEERLRKMLAAHHFIVDKPLDAGFAARFRAVKPG